MDAQSYLDILVKLSNTGKFPATKDMCCAYRTEDGVPCAAGALLPDSEYHGSYEGRLFDRLIMFFPHLKKHVPDGVSIDHITMLQNYHDNAPKCKRWNHKKFVEFLLSLDCFKGLSPSGRVIGQGLMVGDIIHIIGGPVTITRFDKHPGFGGATARIAIYEGEAGESGITIFDEDLWRPVETGGWKLHN